MSTHQTRSNIAFGLWVYLMSDCVLFASLFAAYAVLHTEAAGGPGAAMLFEPSIVFAETLLLLTSSFTCGIAVWASLHKKIAFVWTSLAATTLLGLAFIGVELWEFSRLFAEGLTWQTSAFLSSFFTLVGTHGVHVAIGILWLGVLSLHLALKGLTPRTTNSILYFSLFWHFLDIVWICIFSFVYLFGTLSL